MATGIVRETSDASALMRVRYAAAVTPSQPALPAEEPKHRFARVVREGRVQRGWTQEQLADAAEVSVPTVQRYEYGKTATPDPESARRIFHALDLDARLIPVVLGYVTADEMGLPPETARALLDPTLQQIIDIWEDPNVPMALKDEWAQYLQFRTGQSKRPKAG